MNIEQQNKRCSALDIARKVTALQPGETLYFAASLGDCEMVSHGVTHLRDDALDANLLVFSAVGGGNAFVYDQTEYRADRIEDELSELLCMHCGGTYEWTES